MKAKCLLFSCKRVTRIVAPVDAQEPLRSRKEMRNYSDAELEAMLDDIESDSAERKSSFTGDAVREAVCAFANDLPDHRTPGVVFIGVHDKTGGPTRLPITDELLRALSDIKTDGNTVPPPSITVAKRFLRGADVAVITVQPSDSPPVRFKGRVHIRIGPRRGIASAQDERILTEKRRARDKPFDVQPLPSSTIDDLDRLRFEGEYLPAAFAPDILEANERTLEQRLAVTKMVDSTQTLIPTVLGVLVLGKTTRDFLPGAYIEFLRIAGRELGDPVIDELAIDGPISDVLRRIDEKMESHNRTSVDITSGAREHRGSAYPMVALQQLVRNAVLHRAYDATNAPVRAYWYDDRIEITNPGGPFGMVTIENFGQPGVADYRNPNLAEAMRVLGFVQRFGFGIAIARRSLEANGNPAPELMANLSHVAVIVRKAL